MKIGMIVAFFAFLVSIADGAVLDVVTEESKVSEVALIVPEELFNEDCHQPRETGRCFALFYRYAFNLENHACEEFIYGGCAGNKNNFQTKEECEAKCMKNTQASIEKNDGSSQEPAVTEEKKTTSHLH